MKATGSAAWQGGLKDGKGTISTRSGALKEYPYGFSSRFEGKQGTNPEELIGAAHAGCFSMALSMILGGPASRPNGWRPPPRSPSTRCPTASRSPTSTWTLRARVPGIEQVKFDELVGVAKAGCPVSKVLNAEITLEATLES
ncbi:MAG: OsmC family peroxiredoxin [Isosphaeraceae bacterium]